MRGGAQGIEAPPGGGARDDAPRVPADEVNLRPRVPRPAGPEQVTAVGRVVAGDTVARVRGPVEAGGPIERGRVVDVVLRETGAREALRPQAEGAVQTRGVVDDSGPEAVPVGPGHGAVTESPPGRLAETPRKRAQAGHGRPARGRAPLPVSDPGTVGRDVGDGVADAKASVQALVPPATVEEGLGVGARRLGLEGGQVPGRERPPRLVSLLAGGHEAG